MSETLFVAMVIITAGGLAHRKMRTKPAEVWICGLPTCDHHSEDVRTSYRMPQRGRLYASLGKRGVRR